MGSENRGIGSVMEDVDEFSPDNPSVGLAMGDEASMLVQDGNGSVSRARRVEGDPSVHDDSDVEGDSDEESTEEDDSDVDGKANDREDEKPVNKKGKDADDDDDDVIETTFGAIRKKNLSKDEQRAIRRTDRTIQRLNSDRDEWRNRAERLEREMARMGEQGKAMSDVARFEEDERRALRAFEKATSDGEGIEEARKKYRDAVGATERARIKASAGEGEGRRSEESSRSVRVDYGDIEGDAEDFLEDVGADVDVDAFTDLASKMIAYIPEWEKKNGQKFAGGNPEAQKQKVFREALKISRDAERDRKRKGRASEDVDRRNGKGGSRLPLSRQRFVRSGSRSGDESRASKKENPKHQKQERRSLSDVMHGI